MLFNEPKLLKCIDAARWNELAEGFSALQRAEIAEMRVLHASAILHSLVSVLFNEPKLLKLQKQPRGGNARACVSVLFNEPKLLKYRYGDWEKGDYDMFQCSSTSRNC